MEPLHSINTLPHHRKIFVMNVLNSAPKPNDVPLEPGPTDSVTRIEFNPVVDYLAVGSWDNQVSRNRGP
jgi:WD40 repeat protein